MKPLLPRKKKPLPLARQRKLRDSDCEEPNPSATSKQQLAFPFSAELEGKPFGQLFLEFARSDSLPLQGQSATRLVDSLALIRQAVDLIEARFRETLAIDPDAIPGWGLSPGAVVRETYSVPALSVYRKLFHWPYMDLNEKDVLRCSRINLGELVKLLADKKGIEPKLARDDLDLALEGLFTIRQNHPSLRRLNREEAFAQQERLEEGKHE